MELGFLYSGSVMGMVVKAISEYGFDTCDIHRCADGKYHIFVMHNDKITDIGTVTQTRDNRWKVDRLYKWKLRKLGLLK